MNKQIAILMIFASLLLFFFPKVYGSEVSLPFVGNHIVDVEISCRGQGLIKPPNVIVVRDGVEIAQSNGKNIGEDSNYYFYRDTGLIKGNHYTYSFCCEETNLANNFIKSCGGSRTAVTGEVGGTVKQDLTISNEDLILHSYTNVVEGATLLVSNSTISPFQDSWSRIDSRGSVVFDETIPAGNMQFLDTTLSEIEIYFGSSGNNFLSGNTLNGARVHMEEDIRDHVISNEVHVQVISNDLNDVEFDIRGNSVISFLNNTVFNGGIDVNANGDMAEGTPEVLIQGNEFMGNFTELINAGTGIISIKNNSFDGQPNISNPQRTSAGGILAVSWDIETPLNLTVSFNQFNGLDEGIQIGHHVDAVINGNVFIGNRAGIISKDNVNLSVSGNTFSNNSFVGVSFSSGRFIGATHELRQTEKTIINNCFSGNNGALRSHTGIIINATNNWWGSSTGPFHDQWNPSGQGDSINENWDANDIDFSPWLTASNCQKVPTPPEAQPATVTMAAAVSVLPADGHSSTTLTITLKDENQSPVSNAQVVLATPAFGVLSQQTGHTDASGQLQVLYTTPTAQALNGQDTIELRVEYPTDSVTDSTFINFTAATVSVWADPHISTETSEVAVIPGDSRFPGRYQFTFRDPAGQILSGETLTASITDPSRARLESDNGQSGREITIVTDTEGHAVVDYVYLGSPAFTIPFEDTISIAHDAMLETATAKVLVGMDINIKMLTPAERDTGVFPKTLGLRIELEDSFRPEVDLRAYFSELEKVSGNNVGMEVSVEWVDRPEPEFMDQFQAILPNFGNDDPPELYDGLAAVNYGNHNLTEVITEALDTPNISFGSNTFPAITFTDPGNFWFIAYAEPVILPEGGAGDYEYVKGARRDPDTGMIFGANIMPEVESVFQSVVCSVNPTGPGQFMAMTLLVDNPYFEILPPSIAINMMVKTSTILCDFMKGNYVTAAGNMASLRIDGLGAAYGSGEGALNLLGVNFEQYERLQKLIKVNGTYSQISNFSSYVKDYVAPANRSANNRPQLLNGLAFPQELTVTDYEDAFIKSMSGEMSAHSDLTGWQTLGILSEGMVSLTSTPEGIEHFSYNDVHIFLLPSEINTLNIETSEDTRIFRYYLSSAREVLSADYSFTAIEGVSSLLILDLLELELAIDNGADGIIDNSFTPQINSVDTTRTALDLSTSQISYRPGDTFILSASLTNPGESITADVYFSIKNRSGLHISIPDFSPGYTALVTDFVIPAGIEIPKTTIFTLPVTADLSGAGQFTIEAFLTYPGTTNVIGGNIDKTLINLP